MINNKIYQKYFLLASALLFFFILLGFVFSSYLMRAIVSEKSLPPPLFFARVIDRINAVNKVEALKEVSSWKEDFPAPTLILLNENGDVIYPEGKPNPPNWKDLVKPANPYDFVYVNAQNDSTKPNSGPLFGPPHPPMLDALIKLQGTPDRYLFIRPPERHQLQKNDERVWFPFIGLGSLVLSLLLGVGTTLAIIYNGVKKGVVQADEVISALHQGNLKARFTINRKDEFGKAMMRFNTMADEIEKLVLNLKEVNQTRTRLLQELAHDLRTPIASLKNLMETLNTKRNSFTQEIQSEMTGLALKEINYFERLVEDLLFLAQIKEVTLPSQYPLINIASVLQETADDVCTSYEHRDRIISLKSQVEGINLEIHSDLHLVTRLFRNALENSFSFAHSWVAISITNNKNGLNQIFIEDDGPGFSEDALSQFGKRRVTRQLDYAPNGRLSVGLGSVVMKTIVAALEWEIKVSNRLDDKKILGAKIEIILPSRV